MLKIDPFLTDCRSVSPYSVCLYSKFSSKWKWTGYRANWACPTWKSSIWLRCAFFVPSRKKKLAPWRSTLPPSGSLSRRIWQKFRDSQFCLVSALWQKNGSFSALASKPGFGTRLPGQGPSSASPEHLDSAYSQWSASDPWNLIFRVSKPISARWSNPVRSSILPQWS